MTKKTTANRDALRDPEQKAEHLTMAMAPLPGVVAFTGASAGEELAEERWGSAPTGSVRDGRRQHGSSTDL